MDGSDITWKADDGEVGRGAGVEDTMTSVSEERGSGQRILELTWRLATRGRSIRM